MQTANRLLNTLAAGKPAMGVWQMLPGANLSRILAQTGPDFVVVDCEHGNLDDAAMHDAVPAIAALGVSPIVRIPDMQGWMVKRALDCGAHGILVPLLRTAQEARLLVQSAKFPPQGQRGFGSPFAMSRFATITSSPASAAVVPAPTSDDYLEQANSSILTIVQIETSQALAEVDAIAAVDGIDVLFVGPYDLGNSIGLPIIKGVVPPALMEAIARILAAARAAGKKCGVYAINAAQASVFREQGFDMISVGLDVTTLAAGLQTALAVGRGGA